jgi:hypothetical protein
MTSSHESAARWQFVYRAIALSTTSPLMLLEHTYPIAGLLTTHMAVVSCCHYRAAAILTTATHWGGLVGIR